MKDFWYFSPTRIVFGNGVSSGVGSELKRLGYERPLIVTDEVLVRVGLVEPIAQSLRDASLEPAIFDQVSPNPRDVECQAGVDACRDVAADVIVAVGGGSPMDAAKGIALLPGNPAPLSRYFGYGLLPGPALPVVTVPTTAGTGSEVTWCAVITDTSGERHLKDAILDHKINPVVAFVDPQLMVGMPPELTASTGMDALAHAIEAYTCTVANPMSDMWAMLAIGCIGKSLPLAYYNGEDLEARAQMAVAASAGAIAISNSDTCAVHSLSEGIGGMTDAPHGVLNADLLPYVIEFNVKAAPERHADVARALGVDVAGLSNVEAGLKAAAWLKQLLADFRMPSLAQIGLEKAQFGLYSEIAMGVVCTPDNPRKLTPEGFTEILEAAWR